jgi:hypothetical protein
MRFTLRAITFCHHIISKFFFFSCVTILLVNYAYTQEDIEPKMEKGVRIANFIIYPSILFGYEYNDNVFSRSPQFEEIFGLRVISDNIYLVKPTFKFVLPFSNSYARLSYTPQYRDFDEFDLEENISHFLNFDTKLQFSTGTTITANEEYSKGVLEVETFDPGGEVVFGADTYVFNSAFINFGHEFAGIRGFEVRVSYDDLDFDQTARSRLLDYEIVGMKGSYYQALTPRLIFMSDYSFRNVKQFVPNITSDEREYDEYIVAVGVRGNLFKRTTGSANLSYTKLDIIEENDFDFSGLTGDVVINTKLSNRFILDFSLKRRAYQSFFLNNRYYVSDLALSGIRYYLKKNIILNLKGSFYSNTYDQAIDVDPGSELGLYNGIRREDETGRFDVGINYLFNDLTGVRVGYSYINRESSVELYDYDANRYFIQFGWGWF